MDQITVHNMRGVNMTNPQTVVEDAVSTSSKTPTIKATSIQLKVL